MAVKYISKYTGKQIDEAIAAIIENNIQFEDFSPELQDLLKAWATQGDAKQLIFIYDEESSKYILNLSSSDEVTQNNIYLNKWLIKLVIDDAQSYSYPVNDMSSFFSIYTDGSVSLKLGTTRLENNKQVNYYLLLNYDSDNKKIWTDGNIIKKDIYDTYQCINGGDSSSH